MAESLARLILEADPAIAGVGAAERPGPSGLSGLDPPPVLAQSSMPQQKQLSGPPSSGEPVPVWMFEAFRSAQFVLM